MSADRSMFSCFSIRAKCLAIGYFHLLSSLVDIGSHLLFWAIVTGGFQCDITDNSLHSVDWPWVKPVLFFANFGAHGFYPFFAIQKYQISNNQKCYPGILHVYLLDVIYFLIGVIWLRLVTSFIIAVHKRDPEKMRMFFGVSIMNPILQVVYLAYLCRFQPDLEVLWVIQVLDLCVAAAFLFIINKHMTMLRAEKTITAVIDQPPPYIECHITSTSQNRTPTVKKEVANVLPVEEVKLDNSLAFSHT